jgi:hypothetical protein
MREISLERIPGLKTAPALLGGGTAGAGGTLFQTNG